LRTFGSFIGLALLLAVLVGCYLLFRYIGGIFAALDPRDGTLAAIASVVALVCAVIVAEGIKSLGHSNGGVPVDRRVALYARILPLAADRLTRPVSHDVELPSLESQLVLCAGTRVVAAYMTLRRCGQRDDAARSALRALVVAMRLDLGRNDTLQNVDETIAALLARGEPAAAAS